VSSIWNNAISGKARGAVVKNFFKKEIIIKNKKAVSGKCEVKLFCIVYCLRFVMSGIQLQHLW
jgi:hypothetical protein